MSGKKSELYAELKKRMKYLLEDESVSTVNLMGFSVAWDARKLLERREEIGLEEAIAFFKENPTATIQEAWNSLSGFSSPIEIVDDDEMTEEERAEEEWMEEEGD